MGIRNLNVIPKNVRYGSIIETPQAWTNIDISQSTYDSVSFNISSEEGTANGLFFKGDGSKMYITGYGTNAVYQYSLSTNWDLSTASYDSISFDLTGEISGARELFFKGDGSKMYVVTNFEDRIFQYSLSTPWDISTASYDSISLDTSPRDSNMVGLFFKNDGLSLYTVGYGNDSVYQYTLSSAWDISTASYTNTIDLSSQLTVPLGLYFDPAGSKMFISDNFDSMVYQYALSTNWDITTASYEFVYDSTSESIEPFAIHFKSDGTKFYTIDPNNNAVFQFSTNL